MDIFVSELEKLNELGKIREGLNSYKISDILETLEHKGFGDTPDKIILQCLAGIISKTAKTKDILALDPQNVKINFDKLIGSLEKSIDFLSTELNMFSRDFSPHSHQIVPLTFFFSKVNTPSEQQSKIIKQWFWKTSFSKRYSASTDSRVNEDIAFFDKIVANDYLDIKKYYYTIDEKTLINQKFTKNSPFIRTFLLLLAIKSTLNLINGNKIDLGVSLSKYNLKEYHHIFPRNFLKNKEIPAEKINSLCNFCILPSDANKIISNKAPSERLSEKPTFRIFQLCCLNLTWHSIVI